MEILKFIDENPNDWKEKLKSYPYFLKVKEEGPYTLLKYDVIAGNEVRDPAPILEEHVFGELVVTEDLNAERLNCYYSNPIVQECRGIIIKETSCGGCQICDDYFEDAYHCESKEYGIVCHPFHKFFNYGERYCHDIDWSTAICQEKLDGSLMKLWFDDGIWRLSTNGLIDAFKAPLGDVKCKTFGDMFLQIVSADSLEEFMSNKSRFNKEWTYMYEMCGRATRVVAEYEDSLYFLGAKHNKTGEERSAEQFKMPTWCKRPKVYELNSLEAVQDAAKALPFNEEGYIVCDASFNRIKVKSPEYCLAHLVRNNGVITTKRLLEVIRTETEDDFRVYCPDFVKELDDVKSSLAHVYNYLSTTVNAFKSRTWESQKQYSVWVESLGDWRKAFMYGKYSIHKKEYPDEACILEKEYLNPKRMLDKDGKPMFDERGVKSFHEPKRFTIENWFDELPIDKQLQIIEEMLPCT